MEFVNLRGKKEWSREYIQKKGLGDSEAGILWCFPNFHKKFLIISLSEDGYFKNTRSAEINIFTKI